MANSIELIRSLYEVSLLCDGWMQWSELNLPGNKVYVPTVFQQRDSYSHLMKMFALGFVKHEKSKNTLDFENFFADEHTNSQLKEALVHATRGFFDVAEYIIINIQDMYIMNEKYLEKRKMDAKLITLRGWIEDKTQQYNKMRCDKAKLATNVTENINKTHYMLMMITTCYRLLKQENRSEKALLSLQREIYQLFFKFDMKTMETEKKDLTECLAAVQNERLLPQALYDAINSDPLEFLNNNPSFDQWSADINKAIQQGEVNLTSIQNKVRDISKSLHLNFTAEGHRKRMAALRIVLKYFGSPSLLVCIIGLLLTKTSNNTLVIAGLKFNNELAQILCYIAASFVGAALIFWLLSYLYSRWMIHRLIKKNGRTKDDPPSDDAKM